MVKEPVFCGKCGGSSFRLFKVVKKGKVEVVLDCLLCEKIRLRDELKEQKV